MAAQRRETEPMAELIMLKFDSIYGAQSAIASVRALEELNYAWIDDVAIVEKHKGNFVSIHSAHGSVALGALYGSLIGLLLFWWFPPAWFLGGWLGGLGGGALIGEAVKRSGLDEKLVDQVKAELTPGTSALLLIGATGDVDQMTRAFDQLHPVKVIRQPLSDETIEKLKKEVGSQA
jgi:uncharacterized membrane protein